jgi:rod shape-determining protein MreC
MLIVRFNNYQSAAFFTSTNSVAGEMFSAVTDATSYLSLKGENKQLLEQNVALSAEVQLLREQLEEYRSAEALSADGVFLQDSSDYVFNSARVVNNSLNAVNNYIVIDKGTKDGVGSEMGVYNGEGVVGVIYLSSKHYSLVLPLLNSKSNISCRIKGGDNFCALQWDGEDTRYSYLVDLPRYTKFEQGDTVVTSGFSSIFPANIPVGTIDRVEDTPDAMFYRARVKLMVDFSSLSSVYIVGNKGHNEQMSLEAKIPEK